MFYLIFFYLYLAMFLWFAIPTSKNRVVNGFKQATYIMYFFCLGFSIPVLTACLLEALV